MEYLPVVYFWLSLAIATVIFVFGSRKSWADQFVRLIAFVNLVMGVVLASHYYL